MTRIELNIEFDKYNLLRVKPTTNKTSIIHPSKDFIGKEVCIIPVPYILNDKVIEKNKDENGTYHLKFQTDTIICKEVARHKTIGRVYLPSTLIGADVLVVDAPNVEYL